MFRGQSRTRFSAADVSRIYDAGNLNAMSSALYPAPLMATTMYWRPLSM